MSLKIIDLAKSYQQAAEKLTILNHLNLDVKTSEVVSVVGASGSGKSTFLSLVAGLDSFDQGDILINDVSIKKMNSKQMTQFRAKNIGFIFQQFHLISHLTAFENLSLPLEILGRTFTSAEILARLEQVGLAHRVEHKPTEMSGGECQRLALARGLITQPKLLLADEPSGNLDIETGQKVMNLFFEQIKLSKTTTILVTHDMALAQRCDRVFVLKNGQLVENK